MDSRASRSKGVEEREALLPPLVLNAAADERGAAATDGDRERTADGAPRRVLHGAPRGDLGVAEAADAVEERGQRGAPDRARGVERGGLLGDDAAGGLGGGDRRLRGLGVPDADRDGLFLF